MGRSLQTKTTQEAGPILERSATLKKIGIDAGATVVGFTAVDAFNEFVPEGHRPQDILPGAKTVYVAGSRGPSSGAWRSPNHRVMEITGYDFRENVAIHVMSDFIEKDYGYQAIQAPSLPVAGHQPPMSMMLAAVLAGLGTRSLAANIILNPKYGLMYFAAGITTLEIQADQRLEKEVCPQPMCVQTFRASGKTPCMAACPADEGGCLDGDIDEEGRISASYYNRERCHTRAMNFGVGNLQKTLAEVACEDDGEKRKSMIYSDSMNRNLSAMSFYKESVAQCFECMRVCPVGRAEKKLQ